MACDARRPRLQAARSRERFGRQRFDDPLERDLNEIVVVRFAPAEYAKQRPVYDTDQPIVELVRDPSVAAAHRLDELLVARWRFGRAPARNGPELVPASSGAGFRRGRQ